MATYLELYDALKPKLGTEAARMLTQEIPLREEIATKADLMALDHKLDLLLASIDARFAALDARFTAIDTRFDAFDTRLTAESHRLETVMTRRLHTLILPMWFGVFSVLAGVMVTLVSRG